MTRSVVLHHANQVVTLDSRWITPDNPLGVIEDGAIWLEDGRIRWVGPSEEIDRGGHASAKWLEMRGQVVLPGLIDSHTHAIFAGNRAGEFEMRLQGKSYQEIAAAGGGILKTVEATRKASKPELYDSTRERLLRMLGFGVTTAEVKSGYGLDFDSERKCLEVLKSLQADAPVQIVPTYMGAHDIPVEYRHNVDDYVDEVVGRQLPAIAREDLAVFCDVFCEKGYFDVPQTRRILEAARDYGLKLKVHAEEFNDTGGAELAGALKAVSADHLLHISDKGIAALKAGGTVATLLPGTAFFLRIQDYAPARKLIDAGVPVALATDFNPGSCMTENLQLIMTLACLQMGMTPVEAIRAVTLNAARALDLHHDRGSLEVGKRGDLAVFAVASYPEILYHYGVNLITDVFVGGRQYPRHWIESNLHLS